VHPPDPAWGQDGGEDSVEAGDDCTAYARGKERVRQAPRPARLPEPESRLPGARRCGAFSVACVLES
jgi:hypothetical protein